MSWGAESDRVYVYKCFLLFSLFIIIAFDQAGTLGICWTVQSTYNKLAIPQKTHPAVLARSIGLTLTMHAWMNGSIYPAQLQDDRTPSLTNWQPETTCASSHRQSYRSVSIHGEQNTPCACGMHTQTHSRAGTPPTPINLPAHCTGEKTCPAADSAPPRIGEAMYIRGLCVISASPRGPSMLNHYATWCLANKATNHHQIIVVREGDYAFMI